MKKRPPAHWCTDPDCLYGCQTAYLPPKPPLAQFIRRLPADELHHSDFEPEAADRAIGQALGYVIGWLSENWPRGETTSQGEWAEVAKALRLHGIKLTFPTRMQWHYGDE